MIVLLETQLCDSNPDYDRSTCFHSFIFLSSLNCSTDNDVSSIHVQTISSELCSLALLVKKVPTDGMSTTVLVLYVFYIGNIHLITIRMHY